jgi:hypothetical protein
VIPSELPSPSCEDPSGFEAAPRLAKRYSSAPDGSATKAEVSMSDPPASNLQRYVAAQTRWTMTVAIYFPWSRSAGNTSHQTIPDLPSGWEPARRSGDPARKMTRLGGELVKPDEALVPSIPRK